MNKIEKVVYTAKAVVTGGREGSAKSDDGRLDLKLSIPIALGGNDGPGTNPEQLFAAGYAACFIGALKHVAMGEKLKLPDNLSIESQVGIGQIPGGFGINAKLVVTIPGLDIIEAQRIVDKAHQVCPYSNATRENIEVLLSVG
jgi:osmotically inducible protein OsmC